MRIHQTDANQKMRYPSSITISVRLAIGARASWGRGNGGNCGRVSRAYRRLRDNPIEFVGEGERRRESFDDGMIGAFYHEANRAVSHMAFCAAGNVGGIVTRPERPIVPCPWM